MLEQNITPEVGAELSEEEAIAQFVRNRRVSSTPDLSTPAPVVTPIAEPVSTQTNIDMVESTVVEENNDIQDAVVETDNVIVETSDEPITEKVNNPDVIVVDQPKVVETNSGEVIVERTGEIDTEEVINIHTESEQTPEVSESMEIILDTSDTSNDDIKSTNPVKIGSVGDRKGVKRISTLNPGKNIKVVNSDDYQRAVVEQYISKTSGESFVGPKSVSRVILPYSGMFYDISSYTNIDMLGIHRSTTDISFIEKVEKELLSAWEHTVNNSLKRKLDFVEWLKGIKYPDLWCIYWGIYNVNHPGINVYKSECDHCSKVIDEKRDNYSISYVSPNSESDIDQTVINKIRNGTERDFVESYKVASTVIEKSEFLPDSKFKIFYGMPAMDEVLTFLKYLKVDLGEDDEIIKRVLYPLSWLELERNTITKATISKILTYKYMMYVNKLYVPVYEESKDPNDITKTRIKATYVDVKSIMIYPIINDLSKDDFKELAKSKGLRELMLKEGIHFRVKDSVCPECKGTQRVTALDMRDIIFTRAETLMNLIITM